MTNQKTDKQAFELPDLLSTYNKMVSDGQGFRDIIPMVNPSDRSLLDDLKPTPTSTQTILGGIPIIENPVVSEGQVWLMNRPKVSYTQTAFIFDGDEIEINTSELIPNSIRYFLNPKLCDITHLWHGGVNLYGVHPIDDKPSEFYYERFNFESLEDLYYRMRRYGVEDSYKGRLFYAYEVWKVVLLFPIRFAKRLKVW